MKSLTYFLQDKPMFLPIIPLVSSQTKWYCFYFFSVFLSLLHLYAATVLIHFHSYVFSLFQITLAVVLNNKYNGSKSYKIGHRILTESLQLSYDLFARYIFCIPLLSHSVSLYLKWTVDSIYLGLIFLSSLTVFDTGVYRPFNNYHVWFQFTTLLFFVFVLSFSFYFFFLILHEFSTFSTRIYFLYNILVISLS